MADGIDKHLNSIKDKILSNQSLCKLLYFDCENPLAEEDMPDTSILYKDKENQRLFFSPFSLDASNTNKSTLHIIIDDLRGGGVNNFFRSANVTFIICINNYLWELDDGSDEIITRLSKIIHELDTTFNKQNTVGIGENGFNFGNIFYPNASFTAFRYVLEAVDSTIS